MNSCFEKFVDFKGIMSDEPVRIVASQKQSTFLNPIIITQKNVIFSYFIKLQEYWGNFQFSYDTKKSMQNIMKLMLEEVINHFKWTIVFIFSTLKKLAYIEDWIVL